MSFQPPRGTDDILPPESEAWRRALAIWDEWARLYGFPLVMTPIFESTDLFERGVGDTTEMVTKQMYTFEDQGGRSLTLRPEGTAGVVRAYIGAGSPGVWKGAYSGPFFRYERPQGARRRQFWQVGVEYLDVESPRADAEVIELAHRYLSEVGVQGLELLLNSLGDRKCRPGYVEVLRGYLRDRSSDLSEQGVELIEQNPLRVLDSKADGPKLTDAPRSADHLCDACAEHYATTKALLSDLGVPYTEDPTLVRGLDYYTRTTFEYVSNDLDASQNAVGGGGRYDGLSESLGGPPVPGVGFALGLDRIVLSTEAPVGSGIDAYLVSEAGPDDALRIASRLRDAGLAIDFDTEGRSVKAQFRAARRSGSDITLVWKGSGRVDVQSEGDRLELEVEDVPGWFKERSG
ncbi:MAG: histidine--tRNA ligase [Acidimicrobiia bacterium]|nr:histidine--tRNA ligase [Acidimicrobiia bacterium]